MLLWISWAGAIGVGFFILGQYGFDRGEAASAPAEWPPGARVPFEAGRANLVMAAHPHCPCTRASLGELARLMARENGRLAAHVLFIRPDGLPPDWVEGDLWEAAAAIPGVTVLRDDGGRESRRFGALTSGQVVLYDAHARRRFQGGITAARGHEGDNYGSAAVRDLVERGRSERSETPVFGCSLREPRACATGVDGCRS
jgi:hypothetical protein